jgi:hypothetical protein
LRNGQIHGINFRGYKSEGMPWEVSNAPGLKMRDLKLEAGEKK